MANLEVASTLEDNAESVNGSAHSTQKPNKRLKLSEGAATVSEPNPSITVVKLSAKDIIKAKIINPVKNAYATQFSDKPLQDGVSLLKNSPLTELTFSQTTNHFNQLNSANMSGRSGVRTRNQEKEEKKDGMDKENGFVSEVIVEEETDASPTPPLPNPTKPTDPVAKSVIAHFSSRWDTFLAGFSDDLNKITRTLDDPQQGLVKKVKDLETEVTGITQGKDGKKGLADTLQDLDVRLTSVESNNTASSPTGVTIPDETLKTINDRLLTLESACLKNDAGLPLKIAAIEQAQEKTRKTLKQIAVREEDDNLRLVHPDLIDMQQGIGKLEYEAETTAGFLEITRKRVESVENKTAINAANWMRNTIIFGGVRCFDGEDAKDAIKRFLSNLMDITAKNADIIEAEIMGKGYTRRVQGKDIDFPPQVRVRCTEYFAAKVMANASSLGGKSDDQGGFKYFVKRSRPESQRALRDKYADEVRRYRNKNFHATTDADKTKYRFTATHFIVDGKEREEPFKPPSFLDMLHVSADTQRQMANLQVSSTLPKEVKKSTFVAYGLQTQDREEIDLAYMKIRQWNRTADHIMAAFRLKLDDEIIQGCASDREHYGDQEIMSAIKIANAVNVAVFVCREYGGIPLRGLRFEAINEVTTEILRVMDPETWIPPAPNPP